MTVDRVTLQDEHVPQFVVVRLASFVVYFVFILSLNNHSDPFYRTLFTRTVFTGSLPRIGYTVDADGLADDLA